MTLEDFVKKYDGVKIDFDGVYDAQCVDLFRKYCDEYYKIEHTGSCQTSGGAKDLFLDYSAMPLEQKYFKKITSKKFIPEDVLVWNSTDKNPYGHVAIYLAELNDSYIVFEQDGIKKTGCKINIRGGEGLLGALRRRK